MFGSQILEIVIGMMLIYLMFSLLMTALREAIEAFLKTRAVDLEKALADMLSDAQGSADRLALFQHKLIYSLFPGDYRATDFTGKAATGNKAATTGKPWRPKDGDTPSYIPGDMFADAIIDLYRSGTLTTSVGALEALYRSAGGDPAVWRAKIIAWYDATMERATGWYRRRTQKLLLLLGFLLALGMNVNSATLVSHLASNDAMRQQLAAQAEARVKAGALQRPSVCDAPAATAAPAATTSGTLPSSACVNALNAEIQGLNLPLGWGAEGRAPWTQAGESFTKDWASGIGQFLMLIAGMMATALAISLGAPLWFDLLSKVVNVRSTLKPVAEPAIPFISAQAPRRSGGAGTVPADLAK